MATTARYTRNDTTVPSKVPPEAALRAFVAPPRDGRPGSWSDLLNGAPTSPFLGPAKLRTTISDQFLAVQGAGQHASGDGTCTI